MLTQKIIIKAVLQKLAGLDNWACVTDFPGTMHFCLHKYSLYTYVILRVFFYSLCLLIRNIVILHFDLFFWFFSVKYKVLVYKITEHLHIIKITAVIFIECLPRQLVTIPWCAPRLMSTGFATRVSLEIICMP